MNGAELMLVKKEIYSYITDSTGYKWNAVALRESEDLSGEYLFKVFNGNPIPMAIYKLKNGQFIEVNESFLRITGYGRVEIAGRTVMDLNLWANPVEIAKVIQMVAKKRAVTNRETIYLTKSGQKRAGLLSAKIFDFGGERCILVAVNDITELKQLEKEMARFDQLNLVGEMAAGIGHEIRNPMTTVRGFLQILGSKKECTQYKEYFNLMIGELDKANLIIKELLFMAKNKAVDLKLRNLNAIVKALFPLILADAIISDKYVCMEQGDIPDILLDEKEICQLILNLAGNGLEAMSSGGTLTIRTYTDNEEAVLSVQDQGKGIEPDILEKIGRPFFTTKEQGTGLGLAVCYSIAARHNAAIKLETGPAGTTFFVRFTM